MIISVKIVSKGILLLSLFKVLFISNESYNLPPKPNLLSNLLPNVLKSEISQIALSLEILVKKNFKIAGLWSWKYRLKRSERTYSKMILY